MSAATDSTTKWNARLHKGHWFKRGSWHVIFYLGRGFTFGIWNPVKKYSFSRSDSSNSMNNLSVLRNSGDRDLSRDPPPSIQGASAFNKKKNHYSSSPTNRLSENNIFSSPRINPDLDSDFEKALHHVAFGELDEAKELLETVPQLVLRSGTVKTRAGLLVEQKTLLECALGEGDHEMAAMIIPYFSKIPNGEEEKELQLKRYRPVIENMANQKPYNGLEMLIDIIKKSSSKDVQAALDKNMDHKSDLRDALIKFREAVTLKKVKEPQMHYNYQTLIHALAIYEREWDNLYQVSGNNSDKCDLVWRQVIGYLQRGLPAVDRYAFARDLYDLVENKKPVERKTEYKHCDGSFPNTSNPDSEFSGLGFDYGISVMPARRFIMGAGRRQGWGRRGSGLVVKKHMLSKKSDLENVCRSVQNRKASARLIVRD